MAGGPLAIRGWLLIQPRPASLRLTCDGETKTLPCGSTWAATAQSVDAMGAELIEALDSSGTIIRAVKVDSLQADPDEEKAEQSAVGAINRAIVNDGETERFRLFATLISDAYKYGYEVAFTKMVELFGAVNQRAETIEKSLASTERMLRKSYEDNLKLQMQRAAEGGEDGLQSFINAFFGGMNSAQSEAEADAPAKTNGKSNGKAAEA